MAEGAISLLILRISGILASEAIKSAASTLARQPSAMRELMKDISEIKDELESMQSFLRTAEKLKDADESTANYIKQTRSVAFDIEDIIDEFTYKIGEEQGGILSKTIKRYRNTNSWNHLTRRLREIKNSLQNIKERRARYNTEAIDIKPSPSKVGGRSNSPAEYAHFVKEDDLVGIDENRDLLLRWLKDEEQQNMIIISVWGMGGLGKTTLVTHVYNNIKTTFDACAWVSVSQSYDTNDLLKQIIKEFCREDHNKIAITGDIDVMDYRSLVQTICSFLRNKRYVIILDDVWSINAWFDIKYAFLDGNNNSKIVLTTRIYEVALLAHEHYRLELKPLEPDHSWSLFCKNAFWKSTNRVCLPLLKHWAEKIVEKCCGLPIAIVSIGSLLSFKEQLDTEWEKVYRDLEWQLTSNSPFSERVNSILKLSLDDIPHYLRNCFLYCCIFPEDYKIKRKRLITLWVAEGFIEEKERTLEEVAEGYLNELVHRCLLQVVARNEFRRVSKCQMHDIVRVLALSKSKEENFYMDYKHSRTSQRCKARRISVTSGTIDHWNEDKSYLRSLLLFNSSMSCDLLKSVSKSSKFLCVLDLQGSSLEKVPSEIGNLFNLRFLGLRETKIEKLPKSIGKLQNLQILDAYRSRIKSLPNEVTKLRKLRHLFVLITADRTYSSLAAFGSVPTPKGIWHLKDLQTLQFFEANSEMVKKVGTLMNLQTFGITKVRMFDCEDLCRAIANMNRLVHLEIVAKDEKEVLHLGALRLPQSLRRVMLMGQLDKIYSLPQCSMFFGSLTVGDPLPYIQTLPRLLILQLWQAYDGMKLCFKTASFPTLKELSIRDALQLNQIEIEKEAMPSLQDLSLSGCPELKVLPQGIEYRATLQVLHFGEPAEELVARLRGGGEGRDESHEDQMKIRHIPKVIHSFKKDGKWVSERIP
ncbi:disease resistance protein RPM1-like [Ananas comosus]|uniref:Disease resistance protein RPM1-like n=1 Tax=Ananas comosus TaxID=4615 RepID=A0A6P5FZM3_ANACO|nr:disease resistance protein RPM1-like [Ananas comosus]